LRREYEIKALHREQKLGLVSEKRFDG